MTYNHARKYRQAMGPCRLNIFWTRQRKLAKLSTPWGKLALPEWENYTIPLTSAHALTPTVSRSHWALWRAKRPLPMVRPPYLPPPPVPNWWVTLLIIQTLPSHSYLPARTTISKQFYLLSRRDSQTPEIWMMRGDICWFSCFLSSVRIVFIKKIIWCCTSSQITWRYLITFNSLFFSPPTTHDDCVISSR